MTSSNNYFKDMSIKQGIIIQDGMRGKIRKFKTIKWSIKIDGGGTLETRAARFY